ncbi:hypothetical protein GCM10010411_30390 [Actinomadura fulvescens]|uniref:Uncharacterized protein n=1 Tax=Actinomadura fulvescens TaxID=46160 RepID=A0ABP6C132_9ACTN
MIVILTRGTKVVVVGPTVRGTPDRMWAKRYHPQLTRHFPANDEFWRTPRSISVNAPRTMLTTEWT